MKLILQKLKNKNELACETFHSSFTRFLNKNSYTTRPHTHIAWFHYMNEVSAGIPRKF